MDFLFSHLWRIRRNCFYLSGPQVESPSSSGEVVRLSSWVQVRRLSFTLARVWEQRWKQQESGGSRYWKSCPRETVLCVASLSLGRTVSQGPVLGEAVLPPYPMTLPSLLYSTPTFPGTSLLSWNGLPWKRWSRKQDVNESSWACFLAWYPCPVLLLNEFRRSTVLSYPKEALMAHFYGLLTA